MEDFEIVDLAIDVLSNVTSLVNESLYSELGGELKILWSTKNYFYACASVGSEVDEPPKHYITLSYETAVLLYRDIELYSKYIESGIDNGMFDKIFKDFNYPKTLFFHSDQELSCKQMFISGVTWIFYHELGHLIQEHGYIRKKHGCHVCTDIVDCASNDIENHTVLSGRASAVSHVTEMAADYYATVSCLIALLMHFEGEELEAETRSFTSALALVLYRFHGINPYERTEVPYGSHPQPLIRLEQTMPLIFEFYDKFDLADEKSCNLNRADLVNMTSWSSFTAGIFWLKKGNQKGIPEDFMISGSLQRPGMIEYHRVMVDIWDAINPEIEKVKRHSNPYAELQFSDQYRKILQNGG
ncbi:hypothetical protein [Photobacterium leiognathi]|uniref:Uncharacterized protein n=1 Tax=Photobacterium leiognathi TaxID=553611 RepID=A0ABX5GI64_PHOLE|nr:hypothetical protein [Photobacterium leiognathi]KJF90504.1 hypothetical protein UB42_07995 [Photobacterium leiognathi]PSV85427.1 hypothetical protein CTM94_06215 [Photobacterium leiognathi]